MIWLEKLFAEGAADFLNRAAAHAYHHVLVPRYDDLNHPDAQAARILSKLRDAIIEEAAQLHE